MFKKIKLVNYKTHRLTEIHLSPVTLLIGNNSSGKTNLLSGIQHFVNLVRRGNPSYPHFDSENDFVRSEDYYPLKYQFAERSEPMSMSVTWQSVQRSVYYTIDYKMELYECREMPENVACREFISIKNQDGSSTKDISFGFDNPTKEIGLVNYILDHNHNDNHNHNHNNDYKIYMQEFFICLTDTFSYHLQPSYLKKTEIEINSENYLERLDPLYGICSLQQS